MNKVINIEISSQVFWIDEAAYKKLLAYLKKIKQQLTDDACASEIFQDIELRIAELLYAQRNDEKKAIDSEQLTKVIEQVGYIDSEDLETVSPRKSYLDQQNKILAGVCAGLAVRLNIPAFILRLAFVALTALFGLGIVIYLIFWFSLDTNSSRNATLETQGKAKTAKQIATVESPKAKPLMQLQKIIFLPVSMLGMLITVIANHFRKRTKGYSIILKNLFVAILLIITIIFSTVLLEFNHSSLFFWPLSLLLSIAVVYLMVVAWVTYIRRYYLALTNLKRNNRLKQAAIIPIMMLMVAGLYLLYAHSDYQHEAVIKNFKVSGNELSLKFNEQDSLNAYTNSVLYKVRTHNSANNQVIMYIDYSSNGSSSDKAIINMHNMNYFFTFTNNTLELDKFWSLHKGELNRGQQIDVIIEVPQNMIVTSSWSLNIYQSDQAYHYNTSGLHSKDHVYLSSGEYLHEYSEAFSNKLSSNEIQVLKEKFCESFFISESWSCRSNIHKSLSTNNRFDLAFQNHSKTIDLVREYLLPNRSFFVSNLIEMNDLVSGLSNEYPVINEFYEYIKHLRMIKSKL
ncbi:MAG: PspC domain-containing protein [Alcanivoracaceae bacterium]|nr:PspC domain-containing protein [Alcanivoracaceae bacterium]